MAALGWSIRATSNAGKQFPRHTWYPKLIFGSVSLVYLFLVEISIERWYRLSTRESFHEVELRDSVVPNYLHVNNDRDPFYYLKGRGSLNPFGKDYIAVAGNWTALCMMDSDRDGFTNGDELGDPCCRWQTSKTTTRFSLGRFQEWRRWLLTNPGDSNSSWRVIGAHFPSPYSCEKYDEATYIEQFHLFYYNFVRIPVPCDPPLLIQLSGLFATVMLCGYWSWYDGLLSDAFPFWGAQKMRRIITCMIVHVMSFIFMDLTSGVAHLCLDYCPHWIPLIGPVANGFQVHHMNPALLARKRLWNQVNDVFIIMPIPIAFLIGAGPTRISRLFWFTSIGYIFLFLCAHPWAHMHRDMVPWPVQYAQAWGILLDQDRHMHHHEDLVSQFTILSGKADVAIDVVSQWIPPERYDLWLFIMVTWLLLPILVDIVFRDCMEGLTSTLPRSRRHAKEASEKLLFND